MNPSIVVLDFGSQYTQLIARRFREINVLSHILPFDASLDLIQSLHPKGIVLSGGPQSVNHQESPYADVKALMDLAPLLGVCYGMQLLTKSLGGEILSNDKREYGLNYVKWDKSQIDLETDLLREQKVWMSHGDRVSKLPKGFNVLAQTRNGVPACIGADRALGVQFHPEVSHTENGIELLKYFVLKVCNIRPSWTPESMLDSLTDKIQKQIPKNEKVICALSGGVDSTVVGTLLTQALGADRVKCLFVDNGLLRKNEFFQVLEMYKQLELNVEGVDAKDKFLNALSGVVDPEQKRKTIGKCFIDVFEAFKSDNKDYNWLAQGTLYPDVIESVSPNGASVTIKSHHNVGGLPEKMELKLIEPVRELFKDEVRLLGRELGIQEDVLMRHPFPGPGLAVRILGEVSEKAVKILQECDAIYVDELKKHGLYDQIWQAFCVLLPIQTVGVQGDSRTYSQVVAIRAVTSLDGMTADWFEFSHSFLKELSNRITNEVPEINRVVLDISSKPPATIEWE